MMGERRVMQEALFYGFNLERHVPDDHLLRKIDRFVDLSEVRAHLGPYYSDVGRPSIDPELMIRMLIVGYCLGIRSERRLCDEVHLNLAYRWFCRLGLDGDVPDHSTFSKNRHGRFRESDLLRKLGVGRFPNSFPQTEKWIAMSASSKPSAARTLLPARSRGIWTKMLATWPARMPQLRNTWRPVAVGRKSRCYSPISSGFCA
jgi:transposase